MDHRKSWQALAAAHRNASCAEFIADMEKFSRTEAEREQWVGQRDDRTKRERDRAGFPSWAPLEVYALYSSLSARPVLKSPHPVNRYIQANRDSLRLLLTAPAMKGVWAEVAAKGVNLLDFAISVADYAATFHDGVGDWDGQTRVQKTKQSLTIAKAARDLAQALRGTPADYISLFWFIPEDAADKVAAHVMTNPVGVMCSLPMNAGHAIEQALPAACSFRTALDTLAATADRWAKQQPPFGKSNDTQRARAFVKHLALYLRGECGDQMPGAVAKCCDLLMGVRFEPGQLRAILSEST